MGKTSRQLSFSDAVQVWRLRKQGEYQHSIAAFFRVNQGRISEILNGHLHRGSEQVARQ